MPIMCPGAYRAMDLEQKLLQLINDYEDVIDQASLGFETGTWTIHVYKEDLTKGSI